MIRPTHIPYASPLLSDFGDQYLTAREYARVIGCGERHVRYMADNLVFADFGIPIISIPRGRYRKVYIFLPSSMIA